MSVLKNLIEKYRALPVTVKAGFWFVVCSAVQNGAKFLSMPILVRILTAEEYGIYSVFLSWINIVAVFATMRMETGVYNNAMFKYHESRDEYTACAQSVSITGVLFFFAVYLISPSFWSEAFGLPIKIAVMIFVNLLFMEGYSIWTSKQRYEYKYVNLLISTMLYSLLYLIVPIIAGTATNNSIRLEAVVYSGVTVQAAFGLVFTVYNYIKGKMFFNKEYWKYAIGFNLPLIPHFLSLIVLGESDRVMIKNFVGSAKAGIYSFTYTMSIIINIITSAINNTLVPQIYNALAKRDFEKLKSIINTILIVIGAMILIFTAIAPEFIRLFATEEYYDAIRLVPVISLSSFFGFLYCLFVNVEFFFGANKLVTSASVTGAVTNIALNAWLIPIFGYYAAGYTTFICYVLYSLIHFIFMRIVCKKKIGGMQVYDYKAILIISIAVIAAAFGILLIYDYWFLRYAVLAVCLVTAFIKWKSIIKNLAAVRNENK